MALIDSYKADIERMKTVYENALKRLSKFTAELVVIVKNTEPPKNIEQARQFRRDTQKIINSIQGALSHICLAISELGEV